MKLSQLQDKKNIAILGFGIEGASTLQFLLNQGISQDNITILDSNEKKIIPDHTNSILGTRYLDSLNTFDLIIKSPGITRTIIESHTAIRYDQLPLTSQTQLFFDNFDGTIIGITGTKGKSTTCALLYETLKHAKYAAIIAGNIGKPLLDQIDRTSPPQIVVYELSSFMIESLEDFHLDIGVFTTLYSTHTNEHGGYDQYVAAKSRLLSHSDQIFLGAQAADALTAEGYALPTPPTHIYGASGIYTWSEGVFYRGEEKLFDDQNMLLIGEHNRYNTCAICGIMDHLGIAMRHLEETLTTFGGLEHRLEYVGEYQNIFWYNDAIATTPQATVAAIDSLGDQINTLFYGGIQGEYDHRLVAQKIDHYKISHLVLFPDTDVQIEPFITSSPEILYTRSMEEAVQRANTVTPSGSIALLSCGSPSFSCRSGFQEKGNLFKKVVKNLQ